MDDPTWILPHTRALREEQQAEVEAGEEHLSKLQLQYLEWNVDNSHHICRNQLPAIFI